MTTVHELAAHLGVSVASISRALNGKPGVSAELRERIVAAAAELGHTKHGPASALRSKRTHSIGLVISSVTNPFFAELAGVVEREAATRGLSLVLANSEEQPARQDEYLRSMLTQRVDGIILNPTVGSDDQVARLLERAVPVIYLDRPPAGRDVPHVNVSPESAIAAAVTHLDEHGYERFGVIAGPRGVPAARRRLTAFRRALRTIDAATPVVVHGNFDVDSGRSGMQRMLANAPDVQAVFAANNLMALGALQHLRQQGVRCPDDVALVAFDDVPWFSIVDPPITCVAQPTRELGIAAVEMLVELIEGGSPPSRELEASTVIRASCGCPEGAG